MRFGLGLASLACAVALAACSGEKSGALAPLKTTPAQVEAHVMKLSAEAFKSKATAAADLAGVRDALPKAVSLTWATLTFDQASGATVLTDVKLTPADMPAVGVGMSEVRLWDFDAEFAKARLGGQRLTESSKLASRIEAKGVSAFGLETLMNPAMSAYTDTINNAIVDQMPPEVAAEVGEDLKVKLESYKFAIDRLIFADVMLRPYEMKPAQLAADNEFAEVMPVLQPLVAISRSFAADTMAAFNMTGDMSMTQGGQPFAFKVGMESYGLRGMRGSDTDAAFLRGLNYSSTIQDKDMPIPLSLSGGVDLMTMEGIRLDKVAGYLARGEWPDRTETDLLSLGKLTQKGERISLNGKQVYSVAESSLDASGWHWFIPTKLRMSASDAVYDVKGFIDFVNEAGAIASDATPGIDPDAAAPPPVSVPPEVLALLAKYGLDKPSMDYTLGWNWNATTGATVIDSAFGLDNYLRMDLKYDGGLPTFKAVSDLVPDDPEQADETAIGKVFETASTLKLVELNVVDEGGLAKIFALTAEAAKMMPDDPTGGMMANQTPESLRTLASNGAYMLAEQAGQLAPELKALIAPFGAFLDKGGKVNFLAKPKTPLALAATMQAIEKGEMTPAQFFTQLNAKTVHTPPTGKQ
jgi:hypothetical protein